MRRPLPPDISSRLQRIKPTGEQWIALCPVHEDRNPSLTLKVADDGKLLVTCHAGCDSRDILAAIQATPQQIHGENAQRERPRGEWTPRGEAVAIYHYVDENGELLYDVCRTADKQFPQRRPDPTKKSGWSWSLGETRRVLYRLPETIAAIQGGKPVWIAEGEKDVHALEAAGLVATCSPGGAGKWRDEFAEHFPEADVTIVADNDKPGRAHARAVAVSLGRVGAKVRIVEARTGKDAADHLAAGLGVAEFLTTFEPEEAAKPELAPNLYEFLDGEDPGFDWLMPGILERNDRLMITGFEGWGKSVMTRQLALALASGVHAFDPSLRFQPRRVLFIDCENSERQLRRGLSRMMPAVIGNYGEPPDPDNMFVITRVGGLDLTGDEDRQWLMERAMAHRPDVIFLGPLYYLYAEGANDEAAMRRVQGAIDDIRGRLGCAFVIEAHPGHGLAGTQRSTRVAGSSVWMRWLESGIGMTNYEDTDMESYAPLKITNWKKHRFERSWPTHITHGEYDSRAQEFQSWPWRPLSAAYRVDAELLTSVSNASTQMTKEATQQPPGRTNTSLSAPPGPGSDLRQLTGSGVQRSTPVERRYEPKDFVDVDEGAMHPDEVEPQDDEYDDSIPPPPEEWGTYEF